MDDVNRVSNHSPRNKNNMYLDSKGTVLFAANGSGFSNWKNSKESQGSKCSISFQQTSYNFCSCVLVGLLVLGSLNSTGIPELIFFGSCNVEKMNLLLWLMMRQFEAAKHGLGSFKFNSHYRFVKSSPYRHQTYKNWHNVWLWKTIKNKQTCNGQTNLVHGLWLVLFVCNSQHGQIRWASTCPKECQRWYHNVHTKYVNPPSYKSGCWAPYIKFSRWIAEVGVTPPVVRQTLHNCLIKTQKHSVPRPERGNWLVETSYNMLFEVVCIRWKKWLDVLKQYCNEFRFGRRGNSMGVTVSQHHWEMKFISNCSETNKCKKCICYLLLEHSWVWFQFFCAKKHFDASVWELLTQGRSGLMHFSRPRKTATNSATMFLMCFSMQ